ncbi:Serine protease, partial [Phytophthora megakarya]
LIPPLVYRLHRCTPNDVDVVTNFLKRLNEDEIGSNPSKTYYYSYPLQYLIMFSEMWESPGPSVAEMNARFENVKLSDGTIYYQAPLYCAFSKEKSPACDELGVGDYDANAILYEHDQYWNKSTTIPDSASVLLLSSKLDAQTPHKYAEYLLDALEGDNKELITFQHVAHGTLSWSLLDEQDYASETCGMKILVSYVRNGADLEGLDKSCLDEMPPLNWTTTIDYRNIYLSVDDPYDGIYNESLSA